MASHSSYGSAAASTHLQKCEKGCRPLLIPDAVSDWPAIQLWQGQNGMRRLVQLAGGAQVQAMTTTDQEGLFFGNMREFTPVNCSFQDFLSSAQHTQDRQDSHKQQPLPTLQGCQAYLAQASLDPGSSLDPLRTDFNTPSVLSHMAVTSTNLWMSIRGSRSSLHHDPYHNLLCLVQGKKIVKLLSPEVTDQLYPLSVLGESPNHSHVNFAHPDFQQHPLYKEALKHQQQFVLRAGDALFIPEGWWHQVDSQDTTIAVNFWWQSVFARSLQPHMQQYYLRRILDGLLDSERKKALASVVPHPYLETIKRTAASQTGQSDLPHGPLPMSSSSSSSINLGLRSSSWSSSEEGILAEEEELDSSFALTTSTVIAAAAAAADMLEDLSSDDDLQQPLSIHAQPDTAQHDSAHNAERSQIGAVASQRRADRHHMGHPGSHQVSRKRKAEDASNATDNGTARHDAGQKHLKRPDDACNMTPAAGQSQQSGKSTAPVPHADGQCHVAEAEVQSQECKGDSMHGTTALHVAAMQMLANAVANRMAKEPDKQETSGIQDPITKVLGSLEPKDLQEVLRLMVKRVPRTVEALLLHTLPPAAAELLTQKLEQADAHTAQAGHGAQQQFYNELYGVTEDAQQALHAILDKKEAFSQHICQGLLSRLLGVKCTF